LVFFFWFFARRPYGTDGGDNATTPASCCYCGVAFVDEAVAEVRKKELA
jgi:hypothetical protein